MNNLYVQMDKLDQSDRVYQLNLDNDRVLQYLDKVKNISIKDIEYIPYFRFLIARDFEFIFEIKNLLLDALTDYGTGAVLINCNQQSEDCYIKISTAIAYLLGLPDTDPLSGKHYAIFTVKHTDVQVPNLLRPYEKFKLHTDGAYLQQVPDWIFFMKIMEISTYGGQSRLLHINDWKEFSYFYTHKMNKKFKFFASPETKASNSRYSNNTDKNNVLASLLSLEKERKSIRFVDRFIHPQTLEEAEYIYQMQQSLENSTNILELDIPVGSILLINNHRWLHGRMQFEPDTRLSRTLMRQRGCLL